MFKGNKIYKIDKYGNRKRFWGIIPGLIIRFKGKNSTVELYEPIPRFLKCRFKIKDNSLISIGCSNQKIKKLIINGESNQKYLIGKNFFTYGCELTAASEENIAISIGDNCMFARNIILRASDGHSVIDKSSKKIINYGKNITIGNNVWIAGNVMVLKGVNIGSGSIIGHGSVVTKDCEEFCAYAGVPAKLIKKDVTWQRECPAANKTKYPIDLVYLWCDINDKDFKERKKQYLNNSEQIKNCNHPCRYINNDELRFSLRSVEKYASWINKIYIITDSQIPIWLNLNNDKIQIINQNDILPKDAIPSFNSNAIEHCIVNIDSLSEHFLYANDDMFFADYVSPSFFFQNGIPINRFSKNFSDSDVGCYIQSLKNAKNLIKEKYNENLYYSNHHNVDAYRKSDILECRSIFAEDINKTIYSRFRQPENIHRNIYSLFSVVKKNGICKFSNKKKFLSSCKESIVLFPESRKKEIKLKKAKPKLFCINDNEKTTDLDRKNMIIFLKKLFSEKSSFEK